MCTGIRKRRRRKADGKGEEEIQSDPGFNKAKDARVNLVVGDLSHNMFNQKSRFRF